jgi:glycerol-3-phosphate O-acyltransferase
LVGDRSRFGALRQRLLARRNPRSYQVIAGQSATLAALRRRLQAQRDSVEPNRDELADFVRKSAVLALDRAQRRLQGARYKIPRLLATEIFGRQRVQDALQRIATESGRTQVDVEREAHRYLKEMAAAHTPAGIDMAAALGRFLYTRAFDADIELAPGDLQRIRNLMNEKPVAFGSTHKSHIDGFMLVTMFHDHDMTPLHFFGGINMKFLGLGTLMKKGGAIFVRRSFQDNPVYKVVIKGTGGHTLPNRQSHAIPLRHDQLCRQRLRPGSLARPGVDADCRDLRPGAGGVRLRCAAGGSEQAP